MVESEAASVKIVDVPCLSIDRPWELRVFLYPSLASGRE
jgi:hypothetical protein